MATKKRTAKKSPKATKAARAAKKRATTAARKSRAKATREKKATKVALRKAVSELGEHSRGRVRATRSVEASEKRLAKGAGPITTRALECKIKAAKQIHAREEKRAKASETKVMRLKDRLDALSLRLVPAKKTTKKGRKGARKSRRG